jgi:competence protein ComEC
MLSGEGERPTPGELRAVVMRISVPGDGDLPGMFNPRLYLAGRGLRWKSTILQSLPAPGSGPIEKVYRCFLSPVRENILRKLDAILPATEASLASAVLLGEKDCSSRASGEPFSDLGLAHLFAVSGLHVGILLGLFLLPGKLVGISPWQKSGFLIFILPIYALLTGLPGSVIRASGLAFLATSGKPLGRGGVPLHFLGLLFWSTTLWRPDQVLDTGVRLSYAAAAGILVFTSQAKDLKIPNTGLRGFLLGGLLISLAAQWSTLPFAASSFGRISLLSPLANLMAVPLFGFAVWLTVMGLASDFLPFGPGPSLTALGWFLFRGLAGLVRFTENHTGGWNFGLPDPGPGTVLAWGLGSVFILFALQQSRRGIWGLGKMAFFVFLTGSCVLVQFSSFRFGPWKSASPEVWQFAVGQGDCSVVKFPDGWSAMIDAAGRFGFSGSDLSGPMSLSILPWLRRHNLGDPDVVLLTHGHLDHTGGALVLKREAEVGNWYVSGKAHLALLPDTNQVNLHLPNPGEVLHRWEDWSLKILYPSKVIPGHFHENDHSLVVALSKSGKTQFLWSGDLEKAGEALLLQGSGPGGPTRVWKAGHHGSNTSGSQAFLDAIHPELVLISCGVGNSYHHPNHGLYIVRGDTIPVVRTDLDGSIQLKWSPKGEIHWKSRVGQGVLPALP